MAKKTTARSKTEPKAEPTPAAAAAAPAPRPRARTKSVKASADRVVASDSSRPTNLSIGSEPSDEEIRIRAYHRYLERGGGHGMDFEDWLEAKRDLMKQ